MKWNLQSSQEISQILVIFAQSSWDWSIHPACIHLNTSCLPWRFRIAPGPVGRHQTVTLTNNLLLNFLSSRLLTSVTSCCWMDTTRGKSLHKAFKWRGLKWHTIHLFLPCLFNTRPSILIFYYQGQHNRPTAVGRTHLSGQLVEERVISIKIRHCIAGILGWRCVIPLNVFK